MKRNLFCLKIFILKKKKEEHEKEGKQKDNRRVKRAPDQVLKDLSADPNASA